MSSLRFQSITLSRGPALQQVPPLLHLKRDVADPAHAFSKLNQPEGCQELGALELKKKCTAVSSDWTFSLLVLLRALRERHLCLGSRLHGCRALL